MRSPCTIFIWLTVHTIQLAVASLLYFDKTDVAVVVDEDKWRKLASYLRFPPPNTLAHIDQTFHRELGEIYHNRLSSQSEFILDTSSEWENERNKEIVYPTQLRSTRISKVNSKVYLWRKNENTDIQDTPITESVLFDDDAVENIFENQAKPMNFAKIRHLAMNYLNTRNENSMKLLDDIDSNLIQMESTIITSGDSPEIQSSEETRNIEQQIERPEQNNMEEVDSHEANEEVNVDGSVISIECQTTPTSPMVNESAINTNMTTRQSDSIAFYYLAAFCFMLGAVCMHCFYYSYSALSYWWSMRIPNWLSNLEKEIVMLLQNKEYLKVHQILTRDLPQIERIKGHEHTDTAAFKHFHAKALLALGHPEQARDCMEHVVKIYERFGEDLYMAHALEDLGTALQSIAESVPADTTANIREERTEAFNKALSTMKRALRIFTEEAITSEIISTPLANNDEVITPFTADSQPSQSDLSSILDISNGINSISVNISDIALKELSFSFDANTELYEDNMSVCSINDAEEFSRFSGSKILEVKQEPSRDVNSDPPKCSELRKALDELEELLNRPSLVDTTVAKFRLHQSSNNLSLANMSGDEPNLNVFTPANSRSCVRKCGNSGHPFDVLDEEYDVEIEFEDPAVLITPPRLVHYNFGGKDTLSMSCLSGTVAARSRSLVAIESQFGNDIECPIDMHVARLQRRMGLMLSGVGMYLESLEYLHASRYIYTEMNDPRHDIVNEITQEIWKIKNLINKTTKECIRKETFSSVKREKDLSNPVNESCNIEPSYKDSVSPDNIASLSAPGLMDSPTPYGAAVQRMVTNFEEQLYRNR